MTRPWYGQTLEVGPAEVVRLTSLTGSVLVIVVVDMLPGFWLILVAEVEVVTLSGLTPTVVVVRAA